MGWRYRSGSAWNSGEVVVRAIGNDLHMDYSAIGQTTHLAARMEQLAPPGSIRLTADTLRLAEGLVQITPWARCPSSAVRSRGGVRASGAGPARTRLQAFAARGLTPLWGGRRNSRSARSLEQAEAGHGQVVAVIGEPGIGKTRLFHEFTHASRTQGWLLLESSSTSCGGASHPYLPVIDPLKAYFQIEDHDDGRRMREKLTGRLLTLDPALGSTLPAFLTPPGGTGGGPGAWQAPRSGATSPAHPGYPQTPAPCGRASAAPPSSLRKPALIDAETQVLMAW